MASLLKPQIITGLGFRSGWHYNDETAARDLVLKLFLGGTKLSVVETRFDAEALSALLAGAESSRDLPSRIVGPDGYDLLTRMIGEQEDRT
jgi:hypothetical protein